MNSRLNTLVEKYAPMYMPRPFIEGNRANIQDHVQRYPFATLIVSTPNDKEEPLWVDHLPLLLQVNDNSTWSLHGHIAINNPLVPVLQAIESTGATARSIAIFHGEHHYISPRWYPSKARGKEAVPTWNYNVVHLKGSLHLDDEALESSLSMLSEHFEQQIKEGIPWRMSDASPQFIKGMTRGIRGVTFKVESFVAKSKASQNRSSEDRDGVKAGLHQAGIPDTVIQQLVKSPQEEK